ncbi:gliding motility-associated peptidyl-prolyl isomerase GldI [Flavobacterium sp. WC2421]|jgi:gliding motility-associated peptidyl-prolyl isomerase|uniref:Peptidyl-prolyl cis-trans isomerase n=2 Tax=unclassified Flavobacterium TaxID=196869 RepID=A0AB39WEW0_9FLAO
MKYTYLIVITLFLSGLISSCKQHQEARRPISHTSGTFMKKSVARNKKLVATEEDQIKTLMKSKPTVEYFSSSKGYWYSYEIKNDIDTISPKKGDIAYFDYEVKDLDGTIIYSQLELRPQVYHIDKEDIMMGLRDGIKLMHRNEKVNFLFPSHMGFGYHGDNKKIGVNQPLLCTVTLRDFRPESTYKKQAELETLSTDNTLKKVNKDTTPRSQSAVKKTITQIKDTLK